MALAAFLSAVVPMAVTPAWAQGPEPDVSLEAIVDEANREREEAMRARERRVAEAEARLSRMRTELEQLIARNEALRSELEARVARVDAANQENMRRLIKVYESMEPEEAASILNGVSERVALTVFSGMKGRAAAGIMAFLPTGKAAHLSEQLARPR
jgi:flagellar motility protein MotE (MotC chaperone)